MKKTLLIVLLSAPILLLAQSGVKVLNVSNTNNTHVEKTIAIDPIGSKPDQIQIKTTADAKTKKEQNFTGFHYFYNTLGLGFATEVNKTLGIFVEPSIKISPTSITGFAVSELTYNGALGARVGVKYNF